jgi:dihydrofolate synthase / folylpolyglutamate synthase
MFSDYQSALDYLYKNLPMFQRVGAVAYKADLSNTIHLCSAISNPERKFKSIHIAGTNGKGSSSHMLAAILQSAGYKTGLYTSPHLKEFTERIKINGVEIDQEYIIEFVNRIRPEIEKISPSFFEITVVMAFDYFAFHKVDFAVIETGLGGRLDSTNVISPILSLITNIGYDHMDLLGSTLPKIASEKAGIIKPNTPTVISERQMEVESVFNTKASEEKSRIVYADHQVQMIEKYEDTSNDLTFNVYCQGELIVENLQPELKGDYQRKNIPGVISCIKVLQELGYAVTWQNVRAGIENVILLTSLKGRWQKIGDHPLLICDTGHNVDGLTEVVKQIRKQKFQNLFIVLGMVKDKDISNALALLPAEAYYFFCQASIPRALDANILFEKATEIGLRGEVIPEVNQAVAAAKSRASREDFIFIGGSTFVVGEVNDI